MDEIYRMLGQGHEADLAREAEARRRAAEVGAGKRGPRRPMGPPRRLVGTWLFAFVARLARPAAS